MTMPPMTHYNFGDVVLVPFPFSNQQSSKKRPAVVVSSHTYNQYKPDILLMAITVKLKLRLLLGNMKYKTGNMQA